MGFGSRGIIFNQEIQIDRYYTYKDVSIMNHEIRDGDEGNKNKAITDWNLFALLSPQVAKPPSPKQT
jgi:hypothetical protein